MAFRLIGNGIAAVGGVVAEPVRRLDVVGVGRNGLRDPVVTVGRLAAGVEKVVEKREALDQRVRVGRYVGVSGVGRVVAEDRQRGIAISACHVAQHLIVGAVFTDDQEDVLDFRGIADPLRDYDRPVMRVAAGGTPDILRQIPVIILEDPLRHCSKGLATWHRDDADSPKVLVCVEVGHAKILFVGIFGRTRWRRCHSKARGADALVVGHKQHVVHRVQHNRGWRITYRDHARDGAPTPGVEVDDGNGVGVVERDVRNVVPGINGDRVRSGAGAWMKVAALADRQTEIDLPHFPVVARVDNRNAVAIGIGDQQIFAPESHTGRMVADLDAVSDLERSQVDYGNGALGRRAGRILGDDRGSVGVLLEIARGSNPASLVGDVSGLAIRRDHDAVGDVTDADLRTLHRFRRGQVDLGERIVVVQHYVSSLGIGRDRDAHGIGSQYRVRKNRNGIAARD